MVTVVLFAIFPLFARPMGWLIEAHHHQTQTQNKPSSSLRLPKQTLPASLFGLCNQSSGFKYISKTIHQLWWIAYCQTGRERNMHFICSGWVDTLRCFVQWWPKMFQMNVWLCNLQRRPKAPIMTLLFLSHVGVFVGYCSPFLHIMQLVMFSFLHFTTTSGQD